VAYLVLIEVDFQHTACHFCNEGSSKSFLVHLQYPEHSPICKEIFACVLTCICCKSSSTKSNWWSVKIKWESNVITWTQNIPCPCWHRLTRRILNSFYEELPWSSSNRSWTFTPLKLIKLSLDHYNYFNFVMFNFELTVVEVTPGFNPLAQRWYFWLLSWYGYPKLLMYPTSALYIWRQCSGTKQLKKLWIIMSFLIE